MICCEKLLIIVVAIELGLDKNVKKLLHQTGTMPYRPTSFHMLIKSFPTKKVIL